MKPRTWLKQIVEGSAGLHCKVEWDDLNGSEKRRFCTECQKSVMNLSEMTPKEAESRLWGAYRASHEVPCVTFLVDDDGQMVVKPEAPPARVGRAARFLAVGIAASLPLVGCSRARTTGAPPPPATATASDGGPGGQDAAVSACDEQ